MKGKTADAALTLHNVQGAGGGVGGDRQAVGTGAGDVEIFSRNEDLTHGQADGSSGRNGYRITVDGCRNLGSQRASSSIRGGRNGERGRRAIGQEQEEDDE